MDDQLERTTAPSSTVTAETPESDEPGDPGYMSMASRVGTRGTRTSQLFAKTARWFGMNETATSASTPAEEMPAEEPATPPRQPAPTPRREISRVAMSLLALMVVFLSVIVFLVLQIFDANSRVVGLERNLRDFNASATNGGEGVFISLLSENGAQSYTFKAEDGNSAGKVMLHSAGRLRWAISYGKLEPLAAGKMYVVWLNTQSTPAQPSRPTRLVTLPDSRTGGKAVVLRENDFPPSFDVLYYSELFITVEPADKAVVDPTGPRRYSLDLSKVGA